MIHHYHIELDATNGDAPAAEELAVLVKAALAAVPKYHDAVVSVQHVEAPDEEWTNGNYGCHD